MLNTRKLLYILPDLAYIAELLPTKKAHTFSVQSFHQINGEFINEDEFIAEHIEKLIKKIDADEYHLILPDFLFTNTIVDVAETDEAKVKAYLKEKLLPDLNLSKETHEIDTFILTQHQQKTKVQLSALEKSLLTPLEKAAGEQKLRISDISPLSWTIKSIVSLEPSLSTIQIGGMLYLAQHYIGIDQTTSFKIEEVDSIVETVKTLKGAEPNIQTMYLLTNELIENKIKEQLSGTLPIQQLANFSEGIEGMPAYVKQIIEAGAKTLDLPDHPVPRFKMGEPVTTSATITTTSATESKPKEEAKPIVTEAAKKEAEAPSAESAKTKSETLPTADAAPPADLPAPTPPPITPVPEVIPETTPTPSEDIPDKSAPKTVPSSIESVTPAITSTPATTTAVTTTPIESVSPAKTDAQVAVENPTITQPAEPVTQSAVPEAVAPVTEPVKTSPAETGMSQVQPVSPGETISTTPQTNMIPFTYPNPPKPMTENSPIVSAVPSPSMAPQPSPASRQVIKNKDDAGSLVKIIFVTLGALVVTVAIGIGVGYGLLKLSEKNNSPLNHTPVVLTPSPSPVAMTSPSPSPTPVASASATIKKSTYKILVVNATGIAGRAGKTKTALTAAGYKSVTTGNAKGTYSDKGDFLLLSSADSGVLATLQKDSQLSLTMGSNKDTEDPKGAYDAVIVINE